MLLEGNVANGFRFVFRGDLIAVFLLYCLFLSYYSHCIVILIHWNIWLSWSAQYLFLAFVVLPRIMFIPVYFFKYYAKGHGVRCCVDVFNSCFLYKIV